MALAVTDTERDRIRQLHSRGMSCNEIARELGRGLGTISKHCRAMGLSFAREQTRAATEAHQADLRAWRTAKALKLAEMIDGEIARWGKPHLVYAFGGRDNDYNEHLLDETPVDAKFTMSRTIAQLAGTQLKLLEYDRETTGDVSSVDAWLDSLTAGQGH